MQYLAYRRRKEAEQSDHPLSPGGKPKKKGLATRISKTITRMVRDALESVGLGGGVRTAPQPSGSPSKGGRGDIEAQLLRLQKEKEEEARLEREREAEERARGDREVEEQRRREEEEARRIEEENILTAVKVR